MSGSISQIVSTKYITRALDPTPTSSAAPQHKSFFQQKGKVAGTFTAVGIVVVAALALLLYCCCFAARNDTQDEENFYTLDELPPPTAHPLFGYALYGGLYNSKNLLHALTLPLKRDNLSKLVFSLFSPLAGPAAGVGRSLLRKRLHTPMEQTQPAPAIFPILEFDYRLDPATMFDNGQPRASFGDEKDYSRRILHIANP